MPAFSTPLKRMFVLRVYFVVAMLCLSSSLAYLNDNENDYTFRSTPKQLLKIPAKENRLAGRMNGSC